MTAQVKMDFVVTEEAIARAYNGHTKSSETSYTEKLQGDVVLPPGPVEVDQEVAPARADASDQEASGCS